MKNITVRIEIPHKNKELGSFGVDLKLNDAGSFEVESMLNAVLPDYKLGESVEGAKITFTQTEAPEELAKILNPEMLGLFGYAKPSKT